MKKFLALLGAVGMVALLSGCGLTNPSSNVDITISSVGAVIAGGAAGQVEGSIEADSVITSVDMKVLNSSDADVTTDFTVNFTSGYTGKKKANLNTDMSTTVGAKAGTAAGTYKLKITASAGSITSSSEKTFTVTAGSGTPVTVTTLATIGSNNASAGSSMDLDAGAVYTSSQAASHVADLDLCYSYSAATSQDKLFTPSHAVTSGYSYAANWTNAPTTSFILTSLTPAQFDAIATVEAIEALYTGTPVTTSAACAANDVFVVKTTANAYVLILINAQTPGATGTITVKLAK